jgi:hypothetical protein
VAQPSFVPVPDADRVRPSIQQPVPLKARTGRPGELRVPLAPFGQGVGQTGPDQGYALTLAHRLAPSLQLAVGEDRHDVERGLALLASRRAGLVGRAPCVYDVEVAAAIFGFLTNAPDDLIAFRGVLFRGLAHSYDTQRALIDAVPDAALLVDRSAVVDATLWRERLCV